MSLFSATSTPTATTSTVSMPNLRNKLRYKAKVAIAMIQELTEDLQSMDQESVMEEPESIITQESDLEQEDSEDYLTETEEQRLVDKPNMFPSMKNQLTNSEVIEKELMDSAEEVIIGSEQGTTFPTKVGSTLCNALIDTGATKSCMSESYYKTLHLDSIHSVVNTHVKSTTGSNLSPLGIVNCTLKLGTTTFVNDFIVCQNLTRPLILGKDFLMKNQITVRYAENGKCILNFQQEEMVATLDITNTPQLRISSSVLLPGRTLAVIQVNSELKPEQIGQVYEVQPNEVLSEKYPNIYVVLMIHNVDTCIPDTVPMVIINFLIDDVSISKGRNNGFLTKSIHRYFRN